jgi:mannosyltransferase
MSVGGTGVGLRSFSAVPRPGPRVIVLAAILLIAAVLRLYQLGQSSLWYDEVVTMRLARTQSPLKLLRLLREIDATRAPLHPLLLQGWFKLFGPSDFAGRAFSVLCGTVAIAVVYWIGFQAFDVRTGLWAAWLSALSPPLVYYSREVRMYMWLLLVTCLAWAFLFSHARNPRHWRLILYGLCLIALAYSHPLGLLMVAALALASGIFHDGFQISWHRWLFTHLMVALAIAPWVNQYLDHAPESTTGLLPIRYLLGMPIGFIGGNFSALVICLLLIMYGLCQVQGHVYNRPRIVLDTKAPSIALLIWLMVPPLLLYTYSYVSHPIFGPARYTLFVGPAYLLLVAHGLSKLPWPVNLTTAVVGAALSCIALVDGVYRADRYADWKSVAAYLDRHEPNTPVTVITAGRFANTELETARYYLEPGRSVIPWVDLPENLKNHQNATWVSIGLQNNRPVVPMPLELTRPGIIQQVVDFSKLRLMRVSFKQASTSGE